LIIAQRLVRKICSSCIEEYKPEENTLAFFQKKFNGQTIKQKFYKGKGCEECSSSGYKGRIGVFEVLFMSERIRELALNRASTDEIQKQAIKEGMILMIEDGLNKVASGLTTIEEILRVAEN